MRLGRHEQVREFPRFPGLAESEAAGGEEGRAALVEAGGAEFFQEEAAEVLFQAPPAALAGAEEEFLERQGLGGAVEHVAEHRLSAEDVLGENLVDGVAVHALIFHRDLAGHQHADDRLATAAAGAAGLPHDDILSAGGGDVLAEFGEHLGGAGGVLAGGRADGDADFRRVLACGQRALGLVGEFLVLGRYWTVHRHSSR